MYYKKVSSKHNPSEELIYLWDNYKVANTCQELEEYASHKKDCEWFKSATVKFFLNESRPLTYPCKGFENFQEKTLTGINFTVFMATKWILKNM